MTLLAYPVPVPAVARMTVTLYTRAACCCCQTAREVLREYRDVHGFTFEEVDASDPSLVDRIGPTVPVIAVDGKVRFRGEVNRVLFERILSAQGGIDLGRPQGPPGRLQRAAPIVPQVPRGGVPPRTRVGPRRV